MLTVVSSKHHHPPIILSILTLVIHLIISKLRLNHWTLMMMTSILKTVTQIPMNHILRFTRQKRTLPPIIVQLMQMLFLDSHIQNHHQSTSFHPNYLLVSLHPTYLLGPEHK
jgi:hypothetical protein